MTKVSPTGSWPSESLLKADDVTRTTLATPGWFRFDATGEQLRPGDLCVGDTGKAYELSQEQYFTDKEADFIRVHEVKSYRRKEWRTVEDVKGQAASCVVKITATQLEAIVHFDRKIVKRELVRYFYDQYPKNREKFRARKRSLRRHYREDGDGAS